MAVDHVGVVAQDRAAVDKPDGRLCIGGMPCAEVRFAGVLVGCPRQAVRLTLSMVR
jgi:hypothetical protein